MEDGNDRHLVILCKMVSKMPFSLILKFSEGKPLGES